MIYIFLPAYNEAEALPILIEKFYKEFKRFGFKNYKFVIADDGSTDDTFKDMWCLTDKHSIELLKHIENEGLGKTMLDGLRFIALNCHEDDLIITMDADNTHEPKFMWRAIEKIKQKCVNTGVDPIGEGYDCVILSRYQKGGAEIGLSKFRSILSRAANLVLKLFFPIKNVHDYSCGYRVFKASLLKRAFNKFGNDFISLPHMGFVVMPEILIKFRMLGAKIGEAPFVLNYGQKPGKSKNKPLKTIAGYFVLILRFCGRKVK